MSQRPLTEQQADSLDAADVSVALDAGAGCGKTFVLTERYVNALTSADDEEPTKLLSRVAAITFTEAAASELRARVRERCREQRDAAATDDRKKWERLIRSLDAARISTIHSFCAALIREHAVVLGIDPAFRVLDPAAEAVLRSEVVDATLREALTRAEASGDETLLELAAELEPHRLADAVRTLTHSAGSEPFQSWAQRTPEQLVESVGKCYRNEILKPSLEQLKEDSLLADLRTLIADAQPTDEHRDDFVELATAIDALLSADACPTELEALRPLLATRRQAHGKGYNFFGVKDFAGGKEGKERFAATLKAVKAVVDKCPPLPDEQQLLHDAEWALVALRVAAAAASRFREAKQADGWLGNDDLLTEAQRLLSDPDLSEEAQSIAENTDLLLVDEFQDTDPVQSAIVRAIAGAVHDTGGLFIVGDFKQSIYRFRGAQPGVFRELRDKLPERGRLPLSINFRSQPGVIDFVNTLFAAEFAPDYERLVPHRPQTAPRPNVEFLWTDPPASADGAKTNVNQRRRAEAEQIAGRIRELVDSQQPLVVDKGGDPRPVRQGDVAILFRTLGQSAYYEDALRRAGLDYYVVGGQAFYAQQEVFDVVHLLTAIDSRIDDVALFGTLRSPLFGLSDETLLRISQRGKLSRQFPDVSPPDDIDADQAAALQRASTVLRRLRELKNRVPVAELLATAVELTSYDAALLADFLGERKLANLDKIIEQAREHDAAGGYLAGFRRRLELFVTQPPKEAPAATTTDAQDVVRLMTVHQSKGLEFPVVVLADLDRGKRASVSTASFSPELGPAIAISRDGEPSPKPMTAARIHNRLEDQAAAEEEARLFYVACTRAADRLILSACQESPGRPKGPALKLLASRFNLETGGVRVEVEPTDEPTALVQVVEPAGARPAQHSESNSRSLDKLFDSPPPARALPASVLPVAIDRRQARYSVSRLNGSLHRLEDEAHLERTYRLPKQPANEATIDPLGFGTLVHAVLERIEPSRTGGGGQADAIREWSRALAPTYLVRRTKEAAAEAERLVSAFVQTPRWRDMAGSEQLQREAEFLLRWPMDAATERFTLLQGYIDAAYRADDGAWRIVDYKTNRVAADEESLRKAAEPYRFQLGLYGLALEQALGESPTELVLCFLRPAAEWRFAWNDAERQRAVDSVNAAIAEVCEQPSPGNPIAFV